MDKDIRQCMEDAAYEALMKKKEVLIKSDDYQSLREDLFDCMKSNWLVEQPVEDFEGKMLQICTRVFVGDSAEDYSDLTDTDPRDKILDKMEKEGLIAYKADSEEDPPSKVPKDPFEGVHFSEADFLDPQPT